MTASVVVVGSLHLDIMVHAPALPRLGETAVGDSWAMKPGGKGGNQAVASARHGAATAMVGAVGDDDFGRRLRAHLAAHGVDAAAVAVLGDAGSGMSVALQEACGDYAAVIVSGANLRLDAGSVARQAAPLLGAARVLLLQNEVPEAANVAAARLARAAGCRVVLNAAPARRMPAELASLVDLLVVNALEAEALSGIDVDDLPAAAAAAERLAETVPEVVVTAGAKGLAARLRDGAWSLPAHAVAVVSTHGAGDMFVGALAARLAAGAAPAEALHYAQAAAAVLVAAPDTEDMVAATRALLAGPGARAADRQ